MPHVKVRYPRRTIGRKLELGGFFFVGWRFGWRGREGDVADAAVVRVKHDGAE